MTKKDFDKQVEMGIRQATSDIRIVENLVNKLIDNLYEPTTDAALMFITDKEKLRKYDMDDDPINWDNLGVSEIEKGENRYIVTIEEASPMHCPNLCAYIEGFMKAWGGDVSCETEW